MNELELWLSENIRTHYDALKGLPSFPQECILSSHLLGTYLKAHFPRHTVSIIYGVFGNDNLFHSWVEVDGITIDPLVFQFLVYKEKQDFYKKTDIEKFLLYVQSAQGSLYFTPNNPFLANYKPLADIHSELFFFDTNRPYNLFVSEVLSSVVPNMMSWLKSVLTGDDMTFKQYLDYNAFRTTKKYFNKWSIV